MGFEPRETRKPQRLSRWRSTFANLSDLECFRTFAGFVVPARSGVVIEILGHSTLAMVKCYQHVLPGLTVAAAERMDRVMGR